MKRTVLALIGLAFWPAAEAVAAIATPSRTGDDDLTDGLSVFADAQGRRDEAIYGDGQRDRPTGEGN